MRAQMGKPKTELTLCLILSGIPVNRRDLVVFMSTREIFIHRQSGLLLIKANEVKIMNFMEPCLRSGSVSPVAQDALRMPPPASLVLFCIANNTQREREGGSGQQTGFLVFTQPA